MKYIAVLAGLSMLLLDALVRVAFGEPVMRETLLWDVVGWLEWAFLGPIVVRVATVLRYRRGALARLLLLHAMTALAVSAVHTTVFLLLRTLVRGTPGAPGESTMAVLARWTPRYLTADLLVYFGIALATQMSLYLEASRKREEERVALERWLAQAELDRFRLELPVDEVNARLLEIERAIVRDADHAELLIEELGASLRASLDAATIQTSVDEIAHDETEIVEELPRAWPLPVRLLLLFSIVPAVQIVVGTFFAASAAARNQQVLWQPFLRVPWGAVEFFPLTLAMVWLGSEVRRVSLLVLAAAVLPFTWHLGLSAALRAFPAVRAQLIAPDRVIDFLLFFGIGLGALAHARYRAWRTTAVAVAELETRVLRTRATILRLQLNPHFLFNALNSVAALLEDDTAAAARMAAQLRQFVVRVLESSSREQVTLAEELESLAAYVSIENIRFDGRVELVVDASDEARRALVPGFVLQPLVENALRHGLMPETGGRVTVRAAVRDRTLHIAVDDNGHANDEELPPREGLGLSNTRARLAQAYGDEFFLDATARTCGFALAMGIPYREE